MEVCNMSVGKNIRKFRKLNKLTQEELANKLGVSDKTISSWEIDRTEPDIGTIQKLASYFGCEVSDLVGEPEEKYYFNDDVRELAQELFNNRELKLVMDASRKLSKKSLTDLKNIIDSMKGSEEN
jgi:transcriptional regulator with XRE-family HTH domain